MPQCFMELREIKLSWLDGFIQRCIDLHPVFSFSRSLGAEARRPLRLEPWPTPIQPAGAAWSPSPDREPPGTAQAANGATSKYSVSRPGLGPGCNDSGKVPPYGDSISAAAGNTMIAAMPVFDGKIRTPTRSVLDRDAWEPPMGALEGPPSPSEFALIHGDQKLELRGNREESIRQSHRSRTGGDFLCHVEGVRRLGEGGDFHHVTRGRQTRTVFGASNCSYLGPVLATYLGPLTENHSAPRRLYEPVSAMQALKDRIECSWLSFSANLSSVHLAGTHFHLYGIGAGYKLLRWEGQYVDFDKKCLSMSLQFFIHNINFFCFHLCPATLSSGMTASTLKFALNSIVM